MPFIVNTCIASFWTYVFLYFMTIGLHMVQTEESPSYSFKHEGPLILSSDLGHLCVEVNISQIETGLRIAKHTLKHIQQIADRVRGDYPTINLLLAMATSEVDDIERSYDDLLTFSSKYWFI